jgi:hypothetical protein
MSLRARLIALLLALSAAGLLTLAAVVAGLLVATIGNAIAGDGWELTLGALGRLTLNQLIVVLGGVAFGLAFMSSALAIVMYFVVPLGWAILGGTIAALDKPADWLDLTRPLATLAEGSMNGTDWAQLGTATAVWVGAVFVIGLIRLRRTELK